MWSGSLISFFTFIALLIFVAPKIIIAAKMSEKLNRCDRALHSFPSWFVWLIPMPLVGYFFAWIMMPFGLPSTIMAAYPENIGMISTAHRLKRNAFWLLGIGLFSTLIPPLRILTLIPELIFLYKYYNLLALLDVPISCKD